MLCKRCVQHIVASRLLFLVAVYENWTVPRLVSRRCAQTMPGLTYVVHSLEKGSMSFTEPISFPHYSADRLSRTAVP